VYIFVCSIALIKILQFPFGAKYPTNFKKGAKVITFTEKLACLSFFFFSFLSSLACHGTVLIGHIVAFKSTFIFSALEGSVFRLQRWETNQQYIHCASTLFFFFLFNCFWDVQLNKYFVSTCIYFLGFVGH
jgi:hypothetical protein